MWQTFILESRQKSGPKDAHRISGEIRACLNRDVCAVADQTVLLLRNTTTYNMSRGPPSFAQNLLDLLQEVRECSVCVDLVDLSQC
jgi:hypothetical protein